MIRIRGDLASNVILKDVVENSDSGDIYYYSHAFSQGADPGIYSITVATRSNDGKFDSEPSDPIIYTVISYPDGGYRIPDGGIRYDRDPPVYAINDKMTLTWDAPDTTGVYPAPDFLYKWSIDRNIFCGTGSSRSATIILKSGAANVCSGEPTISLDPGTHSLYVQDRVSNCQDTGNIHREATWAPDFTVVQPVILPPVITKDGNSCTYSPNLSTCDDEIMTLHWCVDFSGSPYIPISAGNPGFVIRIRGDFSF